MFITDEGIRLNAKLDYPEQDPEQFPLVILVHGITGDIEERHIRGIAAAMNRAGFGTLRVDLYGHGKSQGSFRDHDILKWVHNIVTVIDRVKQLDFVTEVYLCGHSQGGLAVMLAAAERPEALAGLIPLSPAWMIPETVRHGTILGHDFDPEQLPEEVALDPEHVLGRNYFAVAKTIHPEQAIAAYKGPVLLIHGAEDETVPLAWSERAEMLYDRVLLCVIDEDTHCYDVNLDEVERNVVEWLQGARSIS